MRNTRSFNGLRRLSLSGAILLIAALAVFAGSRLKTVSSSVGSVVRGPTQQQHLPSSQRNPLVNSAYSQPTNQLQVSAAYNSLPLYFEANRGQTDPQVKFVSRGRGYTLFLTRRAEAVLVLRKSEPKRDALRPAALSSVAIAPESEPVGQAAVVQMKLVGANAKPQEEALGELPGKANYFIGNDPNKWRTNVPLYAKVRYREVYPGVDLVCYGNQRQLEHDFIVAPGGDPSSITISFHGAKKLSLDAEGNLILAIRGGEVRFQKPVVYQKIDGARREVSASFVLRDTHQVGFQVAAYDTSRPLVIDPVLFYSTYLGGTVNDQGSGIAVDSSGNAYVTGSTNSANFSTTTGAFQTALRGGADVFISKLNPTGSALVYSTYLGGSLDDGGLGIVVDSSGNAYVSGGTRSGDFPTTPGAFQTTVPGPVGCIHGSVTKLNPTGSALVYSTYLGGNQEDSANGIAIDSSGNAYVVGSTA
jgi:beta-propeller repeat-containing protein